MMKVFYIILTIVLIYGVFGQHPLSPCPNIFQYGYSGYDWYGNITIPSPGKKNVTLVIVATIEEKLEQNNVGYVELLLDNNTILQVMNNGGSYIYKYHFPKSRQYNVPTIRSIKLNRREYCSNPAGCNSNRYGDPHAPCRASYFGQYDHSSGDSYSLYSYPCSREHCKVIGTISTISINHRLQVYQPNNPFPQNQQRPIPQPLPQVVQPVQSFVPAVQSQVSNVGSSNSNGRLSTCSAKRDHIQNNEFPWLVFLYDLANNFLCGGTLISNKHVITAASCAKGWLKIEIGINTQLNNHENVIVRYTQKPIRQGDIAILVLVEEVDDLKFPPVCIWPFGANGITKGIVVGIIESTSQKTEVEIVTQEYCSSSSTQTLCLGGESGSCKGVSGGGMYVERDGLVYLRGIMTNAPQNSKDKCNAVQYITYTDVSVYQDWLKQILK